MKDRKEMWGIVFVLVSVGLSVTYSGPHACVFNQLCICSGGNREEFVYSN